MTTINRYQSLKGQVALVTGATRGIGEQIANQLSDRGTTVYAGARNPADITNKTVHPIKLDVTIDDTITHAIHEIHTQSSRLDILINNAGIGGPSDSLHDTETSAIDATLAVNLRGPIILTKHALPLLLERPGSRIVNVSSGMGALGEGMNGGYPPYRISKTALNGLTTYLHGEYSNRGLLANAACPGWVRTDLGSPDAPKSPIEGADTPVWLATFKPDSPSGRFWRNRIQIDW